MLFVRCNLRLCLLRCVLSFVMSRLMICLIFLSVSGLKSMMLLMWLRNLGWKCVCSLVLICLCVVFVIFFFVLIFLSRWGELMFDVMMMMVFLKFIVCFWVLVRWLLLSSCSSMLKMLGWVFLILLKRIIEYGLWCIVFVS